MSASADKLEKATVPTMMHGQSFRQPATISNPCHFLRLPLEVVQLIVDNLCDDFWNFSNFASFQLTCRLAASTHLPPHLYKNHHYGFWKRCFWKNTPEICNSLERALKFVSRSNVKVLEALFCVSTAPPVILDGNEEPLLKTVETVLAHLDISDPDVRTEALHRLGHNDLAYPSGHLLDIVSRYSEVYRKLMQDLAARTYWLKHNGDVVKCEEASVDGIQRHRCRSIFRTLILHGINIPQILGLTLFDRDCNYVTDECLENVVGAILQRLESKDQELHIVSLQMCELLKTSFRASRVEDQGAGYGEFDGARIYYNIRFRSKFQIFLNRTFQATVDQRSANLLLETMYILKPDDAHWNRIERAYRVNMLDVILTYPGLRFIWSPDVLRRWVIWKHNYFYRCWSKTRISCLRPELRFFDNSQSQNLLTRKTFWLTSCKSARTHPSTLKIKMMKIQDCRYS